MLRVFILINTEIGETMSVTRWLREVPGVRSADAVIGPYHVIVEAEAPDPQALSKLILSEVRTIPGVVETLTLLALEA